MADGIHKEGRTILFVSHNLQAIRSLCRRALLLDGGRLVADGGVSEVISQYLAVQQTSLDVHGRSMANRLNRTNGRVRFTSISVGNPDKGETWSFRAGDTIALTFGYEVLEPVDSLGFLLTFSSPANGETITTAKNVLLDLPVAAGRVGQFTISIPSNCFRPGDISVSACLGNRDFSMFEDVIDSNVNLPHLVIESDEEDWHRRAGYFSIDYSIEHK
jgi:lipopolysaccharide transport system ATP-binding protein